MEQPRKKLLNILAEGGMSIKDLASNLNASEATVRRALKPLIEEGSISYYRGKVTLKKHIENTIMQKITIEDGIEEKIDMAKQAAVHLAGGEIVFIDGSNICKYLLPELVTKKPRLVVTNSADLCAELAGIGIITKLTGGDYNPFTKCVSGCESIKFISSFNFDVAFMSAKGINENFITDTEEELAALMRTVTEHSRKSVFLMPKSAHDKSYSYVISDVDCITVISET